MGILCFFRPNRVAASPADRQKTANRGGGDGKNVIRFADFTDVAPRPAPPRRRLAQYLLLPFLSEGAYISLLGTTVHVIVCALLVHYGADLFRYNFLVAIAVLVVAVSVLRGILEALLDYGFLVTVVPLLAVIAAGWCIPPLVDFSVMLAVVSAFNFWAIYK